MHSTDHASILSTDLNGLLDSGKHSDVTFLIDGVPFKAHRAILSSRSSVFARMIARNITEIADISSETFQEVLRFCYSGRIPEENALSRELFIASIKARFFCFGSISV